MGKLLTLAALGTMGTLGASTFGGIIQAQLAAIVAAL